MKKKNFSKKLTLKKKTITNLDDRSMVQLHGGISFTCYQTCYPKCNTVYTCDCPHETAYFTCRPCIP